MEIDLTRLISDPVQMGLVVAAIVAFIKKRVPISSEVTVIVSTMVAGILYIAVPLIPQNVLGLLSMAIATGIVASGSVDLVRGLSDKAVQKYAEFKSQ
jgi:hypothetical protein